MRCRAGRINRDRWVSPFGNRRVKACSQLTDAYRSVPRPSSPVCAKASTNCPYLTLESPHHQRHHWVPPRRSPTRQSSARWPLSGADDYNLSQIILYDDVDIWSFEPLVQSALHRSASRTAEAILVSKIEHLTASILKNPFTMSNTGRLDPITVLSHGEPFLFISRLWLMVRRPRARQSRRSRALWARFSALAVLGYVRSSFAASSRLLRNGGAYRDRTDDLMLAKQPLSQLS